MTRIAVLADVHGNLPALEAVLAEVERAGVDLVVLDGDLADGPFPAETLDLMTSLGETAVWLRGNGDRWLVEARRGAFRHADPATDDLIAWASHRITDTQRDRLAGLPLTRGFDIPGLGRVEICHATPRADNEMILVDSPVVQYRVAFASLTADTVVVGHSHMPFDRLVDCRRIVNAGSVGMPYGHDGAAWALIGPDVVLRRTHYDIDDACARIARSGMPHVDAFIRTYVRATPSDAEALDAFHATARRQQAAGRFD